MSETGKTGQNPEKTGSKNSTSGGQVPKPSKPLMKPFL